MGIESNMDFEKPEKITAGHPPSFTCVTTGEQFRSMLENLLPAARLAIDIEADSLYHYFEKVCLIQISTDNATFVVDPLVVRDLSQLAPIMEDPGVEKVFHAAGYDIHCLRRDYSFTIRNIFDTHIAAQLVGYEQLGLDALLEKLLNVAHSKRCQRDDWSRRPLEPEQLEYAAMDTHHLLQLRDLLAAQLADKGRLLWAQEEFDALADLETAEREFDPEGFRRIKGSRTLQPEQLSVLRALFLLRDRYAREMDVPPFKVINNSVLIDLARRPPQSARDLFGRQGISFRVARRFGAEIYRAIERARAEDPSALAAPPRSAAKPPSREAKSRLELLRQWRRAKGVLLQLPVGVVFPGNILESLALFPPMDVHALHETPGMRSWRVHEFGDEILELLRNNAGKAEIVAE